MPNAPRTKILPHLERKTSRFREEAARLPAAERGRQRIWKFLGAGTLFIALFEGYPLLSHLMQHQAVDGSATASACDKLAAHPSDTQKLAIGVSQDQMDIGAARAACTRALAARPRDGRILYQLSRTYISDQDYAAGLAYLRKSAENGYAQGQFAFAMFLIQGPEHQTRSCEGGQLLVRAARQRHLYAKIYLGRYWLDGVFKGCGLPVTDAELGQMISAAGELAITPEEKHNLAELAARWNKR